MPSLTIMSINPFVPLGVNYLKNLFTSHRCYSGCAGCSSPLHWVSRKCTLSPCQVAPLNRDIKRVGDKKIYLMTDAGSEYSDDQLDRICAGLQAQSVELIVV